MAKLEAFRDRVKRLALTPEEVDEQLRAAKFPPLGDLVPTIQEQERREHRTGVAPRERLLERIARDQEKRRAERTKARESARRAREAKAKHLAEGHGGGGRLVDDAKLRKMLQRFAQDGELSIRAVHRQLREGGYAVSRARIARLRPRGRLAT